MQTEVCNTGVTKSARGCGGKEARQDFMRKNGNIVLSRGRYKRLTILCFAQKQIKNIWVDCAGFLQMLTVLRIWCRGDGKGEEENALDKSKEKDYNKNTKAIG